jgi:hypothetical protein
LNVCSKCLRKRKKDKGIGKIFFKNLKNKDKLRRYQNKSMKMQKNGTKKEKETNEGQEKTRPHY